MRHVCKKNVKPKGLLHSLYQTCGRVDVESAPTALPLCRDRQPDTYRYWSEAAARVTINKVCAPTLASFLFNTLFTTAQIMGVGVKLRLLRGLLMCTSAMRPRPSSDMAVKALRLSHGRVASAWPSLSLRVLSERGSGGMWSCFRSPLAEGMVAYSGTHQDCTVIVTLT